MKKISIFLFLLIFTVLLSACGDNGSNQNKDTSNGDQANQGENLLASIKEEGKLLIGTEGTYPPFTFHDEKTGKLTGFDVEIAREIAKRLGVKPVFKETQWDAMFAGLNSKRFDMIANEVGIRPDREKKYNFSDPYIQSSAVLVVNKDNDKIKHFDQIKGLKSAQSLTSNYADIAKSYGANVVSVDGFNQAMKLLGSKRVKATINDRLSVLDYLNKKENAPVKIVAREDDASRCAMMFREGNPKLIKAVNKAIKDMKQDGTYLEISKKWFGEDVSK